MPFIIHHWVNAEKVSMHFNTLFCILELLEASLLDIANFICQKRKENICFYRLLNIFKCLILTEVNILIDIKT